MISSDIHAEREPLGSAIEGRASTLLGQRKDFHVLASPTIEINCYMIDVAELNLIFEPR